MPRMERPAWTRDSLSIWVTLLPKQYWHPITSCMFNAHKRGDLYLQLNISTEQTNNMPRNHLKKPAASSFPNTTPNNPNKYLSFFGPPVHFMLVPPWPALSSKHKPSNFCSSWAGSSGQKCPSPHSPNSPFKQICPVHEMKQAALENLMWLCN